MTVTYFTQKNCPTCHAAYNILQRLRINIDRRDVSPFENPDFAQNFAMLQKVDNSGKIPVLVVGIEKFVGDKAVTKAEEMLREQEEREKPRG